MGYLIMMQFDFKATRRAEALFLSNPPDSPAIFSPCVSSFGGLALKDGRMRAKISELNGKARGAKWSWGVLT